MTDMHTLKITRQRSGHEHTTSVGIRTERLARRLATSLFRTDYRVVRVKIEGPDGDTVVVMEGEDDVDPVDRGDFPRHLTGPLPQVVS